MSLDLIYGTPGESVADWQTSVEAALACDPDHVSAYSLIVEEGTRLARQVRTGVIPAPDEDDLAEKYVIADDAFTGGGPGVVRGLQLGTRRRRPLPPQRALLDQRRAGGGSDRARTRTSRGSAGGTSSTPAPTPPGSPQGSRPPWTVRHSTIAPGQWSGCCSRSGCVTDCRSTSWTGCGSMTWWPELGLLEGDRLTLTRDGRLLADAVVRDLVD